MYILQITENPKYLEKPNNNNNHNNYVENVLSAKSGFSMILRIKSKVSPILLFTISLFVIFSILLKISVCNTPTYLLCPALHKLLLISSLKSQSESLFSLPLVSSYPCGKIHALYRIAQLLSIYY